MLLSAGNPLAMGALDRGRRMLVPYLRALWGLDRPLLPTEPERGTAPFISELGIHLPEQPPAAGPAWHRAAAAHAAAHLAHPRPQLPWASRTPITRVLIGVLEDSRVELLALRTLPGLHRLWLPWHTATPQLGPDFASLLARLARALIDPGCADTHPWIGKGRRLFAEAGGADIGPEALARTASFLGNDIGQMRLQFNDREHVVSPAYRDDNRWLWLPETEQELTAGPAPDSGEGILPAAACGNDERVALHPEWDRLIRRLRPAWCTVRDRPAPAGGQPSPVADPALTAAVSQVLRRRRPIVHIRRPRERDGDEFDPGGLVDAGLSRRQRRPVDDRVRIGVTPQRPPLALLVLLDISASTAEPFGRSAGSVLTVAQGVAETIAGACPATGCACAIHAFRSAGRHAVDYLRVSDAGGPWDASAAARLHGLRSGRSTRLGAALRHAASLLDGRGEADRLILVLTDGQPHDVDVHDPHYLTEDARQAVEQGRRARVRFGALGLAADCAPALRRMFAAGTWEILPRMAALPAVLARILAGGR